MKKITFFNCILAVFLLLLADNSFAQGANASASGQFSIQGLLTTTAGTPLSDGSHSLTVNVYANGSASASFTQTVSVTTKNGLFTAMIGANGENGTSLMVKPDASYQIGISVDGGAELSPRLQVGSAITSLTANLAANADSVGGFTVSTGGSGNVRANTLFTLNGSGKIDSSLLSGSLVTSINGMTGPVNLQAAGNLGIAANGNTLTLTVSGGSGGSLTLPFVSTTNLATGNTAFSITNSLGGSAATFINTGTGAALNLAAGSGSALSATSNGGAGGSATLNITNLGGTAINAAGSSSTNAALTVQNTSTAASANIMNALNATGTTVFDIAGSGQTSITATGAPAINATSNAAADAALKVQNTSAGAGANLISALNSSGSAVLNVAGSGTTTITANGGPALNATTNATGDAALKLQNTSASTGANLVTALNSTGSTVLSVAGSGQTSITATGGPALTATTNAAADAALKVQNTSANAGANLISALNSTGTAVLSVAGTGATSITSTAGTALNVTAPSNQNAISLNGGIKVAGGAVGTGMITAGNLTATINNGLVQANSIILLTVTGTAGTAAVPLQVSSQANGSFVVSAITTLLGLTGNVSFNYLIINQ